MMQAPEQPGSPRPPARKRTPTAAAAAASEQAQVESAARQKAKTRKKTGDDGSVSRTTHGGVKIGGRAVTWVGGAGMSREVLDKMGIPQLRALFLKTFNHPTGSNNAEWLRKKLAQEPDATVGAARAAVPRARDVTAEIWTTGTTFKGFTKQERFRLQQMGGNCQAKVVEVVRDHEDDLPKQAPEKPRRRRASSKKVNDDVQKMQIIGQEMFEMPPPKRLRQNPAHMPDPAAALQALYDYPAARSTPVGNGFGAQYEPQDGFQPGGAAEACVATKPWRQLEYTDCHLLQPGMNVKVYRADERWHHGSLEQVELVGAGQQQQVVVTIYYWEHDQSETRPINEFFRGEQNSLIQWQEPIHYAGFPADVKFPTDVKVHPNVALAMPMGPTDVVDGTQAGPSDVK